MSQFEPKGPMPKDNLIVYLPIQLDVIQVKMLYIDDSACLHQM